MLGFGGDAHALAAVQSPAAHGRREAPGRAARCFAPWRNEVQGTPVAFRLARWDGRERAERAASRLARCGFPALAKPHR